jgi:prepilin peptidase CpaA
MNSIAWWPSLIVLLIASGIDLRTRRIPNWLSVPFLISGMIVPAIAGGWTGLRTSFAGFGLAVLLFGLPCFLRAMGMGDLKLAAGVGAWIGPSQFCMAFIVTGMVGGILAVAYAVRHRSLGQCLDNTGELVVHLVKTRRTHDEIHLGNRAALSIPYAPAIAIGTLFSFFAR